MVGSNGPAPNLPANAQAGTDSAKSLEAMYAAGLSSFVKRYLLIVVLAFVALASAFFIASALHAMNQLARGQFVSETDAGAADMRIEIDHLLLRVKDAANDINSDAGDLQMDKVRGSFMGSRYVTDVGYISTGDLQRHSLLTRTDSAALRAGEIRELAAIGQAHPGNTFVADPDRYPSLFARERRDALVLMQSMPKASPQALAADRLTYVVFDFGQLCRNQTQQGDFSNTYLIHVAGTQIDERCAAQRHGTGLNWLIQPEEMIRQVPITRTVWVELHTERLVPMLDSFTTTTVFGVLALLAIALTAWLTHNWRKKAADELIQAVHTAQISATAKDEFLANMSHEIRTPLNGILGMAELMGRCNLDETGRRYLDQIRTSGSTLLAILNDVLDLAKIDNGMLAIDPIRTNLYQLFQDILGLYAGKAMEKNVSLMVDIDSAVPKWAMIDPTRLRQIVGNLISNAVKFTENGEVFVHIATGANGRLEDLVVSVRDTGIGISPAQQAALFERFAQAEVGTARKFGGTGLGLSITRQLCTLMHGSIALDSQAGKGSTFTVRVPLERLDGDQSSASMASVGVGLITPSSFVRQVVERILTKAGLRIHYFPSLVDARAALAPHDAGDNTLALSGLIIDEAHDIHAAHDTWQQISAKQGMVGRGWALLLADQQVHYRYTSFDKALSKPFLPDELERALGVLIHRNNSEMAAAQPAIQAPGDGTYNPFGPDVTATVRFDGKSCLVVDDNAINQMVISELLETFGFSIRTASDGKKALAAALEHPVDIIMMDCRMPNMDGYDATRQLRAMMRAGQIRNTPIVALTANAMKGDSEKCLEAGMDAFLSKPVRLPELVDVLVCLLPLSDAQSGEVVWLAHDGANSGRDTTVRQDVLDMMEAWEAPITPVAPIADAAVPPIMVASPPAAITGHAQPFPASLAPFTQAHTLTQNAQDWLQFPAVQAKAPFSQPPIAPLPIAQSPIAMPASQPALPPDMAPPSAEIVTAMAPPPAVMPFAPQMHAPMMPPPASPARPIPPPPIPPPATQPPVASRTVSLFDDATFFTLRQTMRAFPMLVTLYRDDTQSYLSQIDNALSVGDKGEAVLPAHTIKSSSKIIGASGMAALAETMESRLRGGVRDSVDELTALNASMQATYAHTMARIDGLLAQ